MVQTIQAKQIDLRYLITHFGIQFVEDEQFFRECVDDLPAVTELDKQLLESSQLPTSARRCGQNGSARPHSLHW
jgi:hypothetical protein